MTIRMLLESWRASRERYQRSAGRVLRSGLALLALTLVALTLVAGCGRYPPVGHAAYELAESVAGVCNGRQATQLPAARQLIADRQAAGLITRQEEGYLLDIIQQAERGEWERAERRARRLLLDQSDW